MEKVQTEPLILISQKNGIEIKLNTFIEEKELDFEGWSRNEKIKQILLSEIKGKEGKRKIIGINGSVSLWKGNDHVSLQSKMSKSVWRRISSFLVDYLSCGASI